MDVTTIREKIRHIENVIEDLERLRTLSEIDTYELEHKTKLKYSVGMIVDVSTDVMISWKNVLEEQLSKTGPFSDEETELLQLAIANLRCGLEGELEEDKNHAEIIDRMNKCDKLFKKLLNAEN